MANCDSSRPRVIFTRAFASALVSAGVITQQECDRTRRIVIDAVAGKPVMLYLERFGDESLLSVALGLNGIEVRTASPPVAPAAGVGQGHQDGADDRQDSAQDEQQVDAEQRAQH